MRLLARAFLALLVVSLIGCSGWHLRGSQAQVKTANLSNAVFLSGRKSESYQATFALLKSRGLLSTDKDQYQLILGEERWQSRTASLNTEGLAAETELNLRVPYKIVQKQNNNQQTTVLADTQINMNRSYTADANDIGAKQKEENDLRQDMSNAAARAIVRRLSLLSQQ